MEEKACVIEINDDDKQRREKEWERRCIYKLPTCVTDLNKDAYKPRAVSFGPYHHGDPRLKPLEEHKHRALSHFLGGSKKPFQDYFNALNDVVQDLKGAYDSLELFPQQNTDEFLQLMIRDGCFMLEILRTFTQREHKDNGYPRNDPIFSKHGKLYMMPYIQRDMLMLENQLPLLVLEKLLAVDSQETQKDKEDINRLVLKFYYFPDKHIERMHFGKCLHVLDVYRKALLWKEGSTSQAAEAPHQSGTKTQSHENASPWEKFCSIFSRCGGGTSVCGGRPPSAGRAPSAGNGPGDIIRSATELREAGIRIKKSKTVSLKDITFQGGNLMLPLIVVDDITKPMFLNLIAFERFHVGAGNEVTAYIFFMDKIIDNAEDVSLLHSCDIIQNVVGSDKEAAKLFNSLSVDVTLDPANDLHAVHREVSWYCRKQWNKWRAILCHTYCQSPWAIISVIAAIFLFALTIVQTIYTAGQYYHS